MKKFVLLLVLAFALVGAASASADVPRYQTETATLSVTYDFHQTYTYQVTVDPCDSTFSGTGGNTIHTDDGKELVVIETITGKIDPNGAVEFAATTTPDSFAPGLTSWGYLKPHGGPPTPEAGWGWDNGPGGNFYDVVAWSLVATGYSTWRNHGDYVAHSGDPSAASASCIGLPTATQ